MSDLNSERPHISACLFTGPLPASCKPNYYPEIQSTYRPVTVIGRIGGPTLRLSSKKDFAIFATLYDLSADHLQKSSAVRCLFLANILLLRVCER